MEIAAKVVIVRRGIPRRPLREGGALGGRKPPDHAARDGLGDVVLDGQHVAVGPIESRPPHARPRPGVDEFDGDPDSRPRAPDQGRIVGGMAAEPLDRGARLHPQARYLRQTRDDFVGEAVGQVRVPRIGGEVVKVQHGDAAGPTSEAELLRYGGADARKPDDGREAGDQRRGADSQPAAGRPARSRGRGAERRGEGSRRGKAIGALLGQGSGDRALDAGRDGPHRGQPRDRRGQALGDDRVRRRARVRRLAGEQLIRHAAQGVDVRPPVENRFGGGLLWTHVGGGPERDPRFGETLAGDTGQCQRDAKVGHHRLALVQQDVLGLDVAMDDPLTVCVVERRRDRPRDLHGLFE